MQRVRCPVCNGLTRKIYDMTQADGDRCNWYHCACGVVYHEDPRFEEPTDEYFNEYNEEKEIAAREMHYIRCYMPLIEEIVESRRMLLLGAMNEEFYDLFTNRGWIVDYKGQDNVKYDLVWLSHIIHKMKDPVVGIYQTVELLSDAGVVFITEPDTDYIYTLGPSAWGCWDAKMANIFWNRASLRREFEKHNVEVLMARKNVSFRFAYNNDFHMLIQNKIC